MIAFSVAFSEVMGARTGGVDATALILSGCAMLSTTFGGFVAVYGQKRLHLLLGIGAGMLLGATFFDLLPESVEAAQSQGWDARGMFVVLVIGFLGFYVAERVLILHSCVEGDCANEAHRKMGRMSAIGLIAHSTLDGAAIGAATLVSWREGAVVALAIIAHDMSDGLNTMMLVTHGEDARLTDYVFLGLDAIAPVCGAVLALVFLPSPKWLAIFLALASGFFLYTATSDLLPEAHRRSPSPSVMWLTLTGVAVMAIAVGLTRFDLGSVERLVRSVF
jgi:zinc transporter ZupT